MNEILRVRVGADRKQLLDRFAKSEQTNISQIVRDAIDAYLEDREAHIRRVSKARRNGDQKTKDVALPKHSATLRLDRL